ncbi:TenA family protein [Nocardioides mangrovi]|uniref:TenA family protein n=1 Tax=Nocardioides mangrovi TaxID=2874580 RepID=A0ABS7UER4_9ACTN|nr:TenA family protein [Nocardioides mangrovi]MBZ5739493.1 TenA family protein [Nocardioides mangrovi]
MTAPPASTDDLRDGVGGLWADLLDHAFPRGMAEGRVPMSRFRFYVAQNLCYLPDYARMLATAAARSRDDAGLVHFSAALANIVDVEIPQNREMLADAEKLAGPCVATDLEPAPATVAYTSWLLAVAARGDADDIAAALLPCAWSYGEIATGLIADSVQHPLYQGWLDFFAAPAYAAVVDDLRDAFDRRLSVLPDDARRRAAETFRTGCRLERQFWDQARDGAQWPDLTTTRTLEGV